MAQRFFEGALHAATYAKFRPQPPVQLANKILSFLKEKYNGPLALCVDVGCGSGQCTSLFSRHFTEVLGTDVSQAQIQCAEQGNFPSNVRFQVSPAEKIPVNDGSVQLLSAGQACHWFDLPAFFKEVDRVLSINGVVAIYAHGFSVFCQPAAKATELQDIFNKFYRVKTAGYWGEGRTEVDNEYRNIVIPYTSFTREEFWTDTTETSLSDFTGYLSSWSGVQNYIARHGEEAGTSLLNSFVEEFRTVLGTDEDPANIILGVKRKYFLLLGRKD